jgi:hypothetical protein
MRDGTCAQFSLLFKKIIIEIRSFWALKEEQGLDISRLQAKKTIISGLLSKLEEARKPEYIFLNKLFDKKILSKLDEIFKSYNNSEKQEERAAFDRLSGLFENLKPGKIDSGSYHRFIKLLSDKITVNAITEALNNTNAVGKHAIISMLHSIFLNKFADNRELIEFKDGYPAVLENFNLLYLERGKIKAGDLGKFACEGMKGGTVIADRMSLGSCDRTTGGTVFVNTLNSASFNPEGGTFFIKDSRDTGGLAAEGAATVLVEKSNAEFDQFYCRDKDNRSYYQMSKGKLPFFMDDFVAKIDADDWPLKKGLYVYKNSKPPFDITKIMEGGIVVYWDISKMENIGDEMTGGIVIIEGENTDLEAVKKKISDNRKGGLVFVNMKDKYLPDKYNLVLLDEIN